MSDNLIKVYRTLQNEGYELPKYEEFETDMRDDKLLGEVRQTLVNAGYTPPAFDEFKFDMWGTTPAPTDKSLYTFTSEQLGLEPEEDDMRSMTVERQTSMPTPMWGTISAGENRREPVKDLGSASSGQGGISEYIEMLSGVKSEGQEKAEAQMETAKERAARGETMMYPYGDTQKPLISAPDIRVEKPWQERFDAEKAADKAVKRIKPGDAFTEARNRAWNNIGYKEHAAKVKANAEAAVGEMRERLTVISDRLADADAKRPPVVVGNPTTMGGMLTKQRAFEKDYRELRAADNLLSQTEKMVETFNAGKEMGGWANLSRSAATTVFDPKTWDMGLSDMLVADQLLSVVEKADKGEKLSESEQLLLDAAINQQVMQAYYGELSGWQKAGKMFGESLPFMAQIAVNPLASLGKYASSKAAKAVVKHIAKKVGEKGVKKILAKTAGITGRALGDLAGSYGVALTSNLGNTTADALNRQIGDIQYDFDDNGVARYNGRLNVREAGEAWLDAINNQAFEFYSEQMGNYFAPILKGMGKLGGKALKNFGMDGVNRWVSDFAKKGSVRQLNQFFDKTQFHGFASEYAEEIANGMLNAAFVGDMTMEDVFSKDNLIDTAIGLSVMGAIGPMVGTAGYARAKYNEKQALNAADESGRKLMGHAWDYFADAVRRSKNSEELSANLRETLNSFGRKALPGEDMRQILSYAQAYNRYKAVEEVSAAAVAEGVMDERDLELQRQYENGQTTTDKHGLRVTFEAAADAVEGIIPLDIGEYTAYDIADEYDEQGDADTATAIRVFLSARAAHSGMTAQIREQAQSELESAYAEIDSRTNKTDGNIYSVTLGGGLNGYVTGGTVITDSDGDIDIDATREANEGGYIYVNVDGVVKPKSVDDFVSLDGVESAADAKAAREAEINAALNAQYEELTAPVETQEATPASTEVTPESAAPAETAVAPVNNTPIVSNEVAENAARALGVLPEELEEVILDEQEGLERAARYNNIGDTDSADAIRAYVAERFGTPAVQSGNNVADKREQSTSSLDAMPSESNLGEANGAENIPAPENVAPIPVEKRGKEERQAFHLVPVERTTEELYNSGLDQQEIDAFVQANIDEINSDIEKHSKKQPKMGANIAAYKAAKEQWQAQNEDLSARLNYYKALQDHIKGITTSNTAEAINDPIADVSDITTPQPTNAGGTEPVGTGQQGGAAASSVQSNGANVAAQRNQEVSEPVGNSEQLNQSEDNLEMDARLINEVSNENTLGRSLSEQEAQSLIAEMENNAEVAPEIDLTIDNWDALFGEDGTVNTPIGEVKMGENQFTKLMRQDRNGKLGMIKPTLENPDAIIEDKSKAKEGDTTERASSYVFVKAFKKADGTRYYYFTSVTVSKDNKEVVISNQEKRRNAIANLLVNGKLVWKHADNVSSASDVANGLYSSQVDSSELATEGTDAPQTNGTISTDVPSSADESTTQSANSQENSVKSGENTQNGGEITRYSLNTLGSSSQMLKDIEALRKSNREEFEKIQPVYEYLYKAKERGLYPDEIAELKGILKGTSLESKVNSWFTPVVEEQSSTNVEKSQVIEDNSTNSGEQSAPTISQESEQVGEQDSTPYTIAPAQYTTKKGKVLDMHLVKFAGTLTKEQQRAAKELAKAEKGWYDREQGGFMMRSEESAKQLADTILNNDDAVSDAQPVSMTDIQALNNGDVLFTEPQQTKGQETQQTPFKTEKEAKDYLVSIGYSPDSLYMNNPKNEGQDYIDEANYQMRKHSAQPTNPSGNRLVTDERYAELRERMRKKLGGQMNIGIDPEILAIGTEMAVYHLEKGARKFTEYAKVMIADLGDAIRPYLKAFYNGARNLPEVESSEIAADMTPYDEVQNFDVANFGKPNVDILATAETIAKEQEVANEVETAKQKIINQRNTERRQEDEQTSAITEAIASQAETVAGEAERIIEEATTEEEITEVEQQIDEQLNAIDEQLAKFNIDDLHSGMRVILKDGRNVLLSMVMHSGEQLSATQFSKPRVHRLYGIHNGQMVDISPADVDVDATRRLLEGNEVATPVEEETKQAKTKKSKKKAVNLQQSDELGLFDSLFDNETNNEDGLQRNDDVRTGGLQANNSGHRQGLQASTEKGSESEQQDSRGTDLGGERTGDAVDRTVRPRLSDAVTEKKNTRNNHSERGKDHAPTSVDARIEANIKAIELAKQLLESGEQATEKQMQTLRKFSGWGGLGKAFSEGTYYAPNLIAKRLRELLGEAAYQEAVMSANSAYYTPAYVVDTLWDIAEQMGFKGGNILEGSAGIGNILGQMPTHISERSNIHAIEIDGTSGGILSLLYPDAKVEIQGFEETRIANGSVDLAITNVPFVTGLRVNDTTGDKDLSKKFHNIHDFCIAKNVRKLREGGLGIFITSNGTLDNSKKLRDWIVNEGGADFVGAFRMHNKTFGGTGVTSDIIVIRKRVNGKKSANAIDVSTVTGERMTEYDTGETRKVKGQIVPVVKQLSMDYNQYFVEHPENMAGEMHFAFEKGDTFRPTSKGLYPKKDKKQEQMLAEFVQSFTAEEFGRRNEEDEINSFAQAMQGKKLGEMFVNDGELYTYTMQGAQPISANSNKVKGHTKVECFEAYSAIKEALAAVLEYQITHEDDKGLKPLLAKLNKAYDDFVATYGHFNKNTAIAFLRNDVDYANVFALEKFEESADAKGNKVQKFGKTDVFSKRVIEKEAEPMPTNVKDGIVASIFKFGRVDIPYIAEQLGKSEAEVKAEIIESGYGFEDPATRQVEVSYQYLSGNVREKLRQAQENNENGEFDRNIKALQEVMPMTIPAHLIDFTLGSSWIEPKLYEEYVKERTDVGVQFTAVGGTWFMNEPYFTNYEKNRAMGVTSEMLGRTVMGHTLIEAAIQNRSITVSTTKKNWDGSTETITDKEATQACSAKIDEIRQDFKEWARQKMQSDAEMSERMERVYNDTFNNYVPMSIPDEFVPEYFGGASHNFKMHPHQGRAIVRGTMQPLLLAHEVGTGKTFTLISTAMEMRRLGTARKPMIVVQNATVGQFVASAKELYPNAKILTLEEADRSADGRKNFYAKIKYNDWDMIVVPQSTFEFIPDSEERQMAFVQEKIEEKMLVLEQMKEADPDGKSMITRQAEREIALLEEELAGLSGETGKKRTANDEKKRAVALQNAEVKAMEMLDRRTDDVENFDDMGIDALLIDEAHEYKHLGFATAMQRGVKGVDPSYSKKSQGVFLKTQAVLEKNNGRNVIFATGTPISNTAAEIWTFMRYLMPADTMKEYGIYYFDDFVRNFGNIQQMLEFTTSGKFKENNRFAGYVNLPELVRIWSGVSDTVLTKEAGGVSDKIPDMEGGKAQDLYLPQTRALRSIMKYVKAELERYDKMSGKKKKESSHIPLTMYGIAKAAAVDARLVQSDAEDDAQSKTNEAVRQTLRSLKESADYKGTVAIFADNYQNKESGFNLYEDIRAKLIAEGVPADEIVVIKSGMTVKKKLEIFEKVNRGEVRVILGSTFTLGTGVNIQERLYTLIHLDAPNRPMDYTQRNGRILRQGNLHKAMGKPVRVLRFGVEDSLDVTAYQRLKTKGAIADSIMNGKQMMANSMTNRVLEEEEDVFGDTVAQLSGSEYAMLKNNAEKNVRKYASRKKQWEADQTYIHNAKPKIKGNIKDAEKRIEDNSRYLEAVRASFSDGKFKEIVIGKRRFATIEAMEEFFKEHNKSVLAEMKQMKDGEIAGEQKRQLTIQIGDFSFVVTTKLTRQTVRDGATLFNDVERKMTYSCAELGIEDIPVRQNLLRNAIEDITNNVITGRDFAERVEIAERVKKHNEAELEQLLSREGKPFEYEAELEQAQTQYEEFSELMKKELAEKEAKYAEMDATVDTAANLSNTDEEDGTLYRSDNEVPRLTKHRVEKIFGGIWIDDAEEFAKFASAVNNSPFEEDGEGIAFTDNYFYAYYLNIDGQVIPFASVYLNSLESQEVVNQVNQEIKDGRREKGVKEYIDRAVIRARSLESQDNADNGNNRSTPNRGRNDSVDSNISRKGRYYDRPSLYVKTQRADRFGLLDEYAREGEGTYTDEEINFANDPVSKVLGKPRGTKKKQREFAARQRQRMAERVESLAKKLHLDNVEIITDASALEGKKQRAKGFYSKSTGKITIVIPNHSSAFDVEQTLLHEAVAHYGLRQLFGEHFDTFLDNVFKNADVSIRKRIIELAQKKNWDLRTATEEYLASLAEETKFENTSASWWRQIKELFLNMLHKIGFEDFGGVTLTDNELRYILWRSYENLAEPGKFRSILGEVSDIAKQYELGVGNYAQNSTDASTAAENNDLFRDGDPEIHERALARDRYERLITKGLYQAQEVQQDSMLALEKAMLMIDSKTKYVEDIPAFENAYLGENALSSVNQNEVKVFHRFTFKPLLDEVAKLARNEAEREELTDYMMAKHGLERNRVMAERDARAYVDSEVNKLKKELKRKGITEKETEAINKKINLLKAKLDGVAKNFSEHDARIWYETRRKSIDNLLKNGEIDKTEYNKKMARLNTIFKEGYIGLNRGKDYAGLTALTGMDNVADAEAEAQRMVDDYEQAHETDDLWKKVNAVSKAILQKSYECGMMSKETFDKVSNMYEFYIPLRGFDEKTSDEAYAYLTHKNSAFNAPIKKAGGRKSKADNPLVYLESMAESAIMQGNRNRLIKQRFFNFVLNHPSDLVSISDLWVEYNSVKDEWQPVFPDNINSTDTPEEVEKKMQSFEAKMEALAQQNPDQYKKGKDAVGIPYRVVESRDMREHQIIVKRGGRDYVLTVNGNPRLAQAVNGLTNPDNNLGGTARMIVDVFSYLTRSLSAIYTTLRPDFIAGNFGRDIFYSNFIVWIKESPNYAWSFNLNYLKVFGTKSIKRLLAKYRKGTLDMNNETESMFELFMKNGGETGYHRMLDIDTKRKELDRKLKAISASIPFAELIEGFIENLGEFGRAVELQSRFAAFITSREFGRSVGRAIWDAKEISVNFNKKGSGDRMFGSNGQTFLGNLAAGTSWYGRTFIAFYNAAIQGTFGNFGKYAIRNPKKTLAAISSLFSLGFLIAALGAGDDDDEKENYYNLPEYTRRNNICIKLLGNTYSKYPLPIEFRSVYGLGELCGSAIFHKEEVDVHDVLVQVSQIMPIDMMAGQTEDDFSVKRALTPTLLKTYYEAEENRSWTGLPIWKDTPFNKNLPGYTKAYRNANKHLVNLSEALNAADGKGDTHTRGKYDFNPAKVEYILKGYTGGFFDVPDQINKMWETAMGERDFDWRNVPLMNRFFITTDERTEYRAVNNKYYRLKEERDETMRRLRAYEKDADNGILDYLEKIDFLYNSPEYERALIFDSYYKDGFGIRDYDKALKEETDDEIIEELVKEQNELKRELIKAVKNTYNK